ncbi:MAG: DNA primase [Phycisphaerales bacterium]|nr:DNA primase [Phycisphaerales bacterium]
MSGFAPEQDDRQRVRDASDIVAVVGEHLALKPKGREYVGLCPFHDDRNPSMCVIPAKQIFHCFVCGTGGDVFTFIQKYHSMGFRESLEYLAERGNIELTKFKPGGGDGAGVPFEHSGVGKKEIMAANQAGQSFFQTILTHPEHGTLARSIIEKRGISQDMVERFAIGASPDRWDGLLKTAQGKGLNLDALIGAGLIKAKDSGGHYDALRNRLIFPICDQIGRVIAFGGRIMNEDDSPKYLNSPETPVFRKSMTLYGINHAQRAIKKERTAVIVEGYTDVIACHQAGVEHVVGTLGTALTGGHATVLRRLCDTVVLLFDGGEAGIKAADRAIEVLLGETIDIRIAALSGFTDAKDPDELLKRDGGAEIFKQVIENSVDLIKWRFDRLREELKDAGPARITQRIEDELAKLSDLGLGELTPVRRSLMIRQVARAAQIEEGVVTAAIRTGRSRRRPSFNAPNHRANHPAAHPADLEQVDQEHYEDTGEQPEFNWKPNARETLLGCLLYDSNLWLVMSSDERELTSTTSFGSPLSRVVADALHSSAENGTGTGLHAVLDELAALGEETGKNLVEAEQRATMLRQIIARDSEGVASRVTRMFNECVGDVSLADARVQRQGIESSTINEPVDEGAKLRAFIEEQRVNRKRFGRSGKNMLSGE